MNTDRIGVLVGVDASACSQEALVWAAADAHGRRVPLTIRGRGRPAEAGRWAAAAQALTTFVSRSGTA
jgi:hypothetical protein